MFCSNFRIDQTIGKPYLWNTDFPEKQRPTVLTRLTCVESQLSNIESKVDNIQQQLRSISNHLMNISSQSLYTSQSQNNNLKPSESTELLVVLNI